MYNFVRGHFPLETAVFNFEAVSLKIFLCWRMILQTEAVDISWDGVTGRASKLYCLFWTFSGLPLEIKRLFSKLLGFMQKLKQKCRAKTFCGKAILLGFEACFKNRQVCSWVEEPYHKDVLLSHKLFIMFGESEKRQHVLAFFPRWEKLLQSKSIFSKHHWRSASLFRVQTDQKGICLYPFYWPVREKC